MSADRTASAAVRDGAGEAEKNPASPDPAAVFGNVVRTARRQFVLVALVTASTVGVAAAFAYLSPVSYSSSAEILLDQTKNKVADLSNVSNVVEDIPNDPASTQNQIRVLTSRNLAERVINRLHLDSDPELNATGAGPSAGNGRNDSPANIFRNDDRTIDAFLRHLGVEQLGLSTTIAITFTSHSPQKAAAIANTVAETYIQHQIESNSQTARASAAWLSQQVHRLASDTQSADAAVQAYKRLHNLSEVTGETPLLDQELLAVQSQLVQARAALAEKLAMHNRLHALAASGNAADFSEVASSPVIVQLRQQEADTMRQEADLATRYGPKNPKIVAMESERNNIEEKIEAEITRIEGAADSDLVVAQAEVQSLEATLDATENKAASENAARVELEALESNAKSTHASYEAFVSRLREVQGQDALQLPDASIISWAPVPASPNFPRRLPFVVASIPVGFLFGLLVAIVRERRRRDASAETHAEATLPAPLLIRIPDLARQGLSASAIVDEVGAEPETAFSRAVALLDARMDARGDAGPSVIGISSPGAAQGKSILAISLARMSARRGLRVVLLETDTAANLCTILRLAAGRLGLSDVLLGRAPLSQCVIRDERSNVYLLLQGSAAKETDSASRSEAMGRLLDHLRHSCDLVIVDLPYSGPLSRAVTDRLDAMVLLLGWNGSRIPDVAEINARLSGCDSCSVGLVLAT